MRLDQARMMLIKAEMDHRGAKRGAAEPMNLSCPKMFRAMENPRYSITLCACGFAALLHRCCIVRHERRSYSRSQAAAHAYAN
jgi:hypothetical protein